MEMKAKEIATLVKEIREFIEQPETALPSMVEYQYDDITIVKVFCHRGERGPLIGVDQYMIDYTLPFAKVLHSEVRYPEGHKKAGELRYRPGDIVRLFDDQAGVTKSPKHKLWETNEMNNSSATKIGKEPPKMIDNTYQSFTRKRLRPNPFSPVLEDENEYIYFLNTANIVGKIPHEDIEFYIEDLLEKKTEDEVDAVDINDLGNVPSNGIILPGGGAIGQA